MRLRTQVVDLRSNKSKTDIHERQQRRVMLPSRNPFTAWKDLKQELRMTTNKP